MNSNAQKPLHFYHFIFRLKERNSPAVKMKKDRDFSAIFLGSKFVHSNRKGEVDQLPLLVKSSIVRVFSHRSKQFSVLKFHFQIFLLFIEIFFQISP
jgi:hypothetical protein